MRNHFSQPLRLSNISQLAGIPYKALAKVEGAVYEEDSPTENARKLWNNEADAALIPVYEFLSKNIYQSLDFGMGCRSRSDSMVLYSNSPLEALRRVHVYQCSCSSMALMQILMREVWDIQPEIVRERTLTPFAEMQRGEGALVLHELPGSVRSDFLVCEDLAQAWQAHTNLPFVFLVWAARPGAFRSGQLDSLQRWMYRGLHASGALTEGYCAQRGIDPAVGRVFIQENRRYQIDDFLMGGLEEFLIRAQRHRLLGRMNFRSVRRTLFGQVV